MNGRDHECTEGTGNEVMYESVSDLNSGPRGLKGAGSGNRTSGRVRQTVELFLLIKEVISAS